MIEFRILALATILLMSCKSGLLHTAKQDFERTHPSAVLVEYGVGEGDGAAAYVHLKYRQPGSDEVREEVWQYIKNNDGNWILTNTNAK